MGASAQLEHQFAQAYSFLKAQTTGKPLVGISACLCGDKVRYDGREKGLPELIGTLEQPLELFKVCPEVAIGMTVPRPPIQLVEQHQLIEARGVEKPAQNPTAELQAYALSVIDQHKAGNALCGFILKSRSPSCGFGSTPIHKKSQPIGLGNGIFAHQLRKKSPWLPIAEEQSLQTITEQQHFIMCCQLLHAFWQVKDSPLKQRLFHNKMTPLFEKLIPQTEPELASLVSGSPESYLTKLMTDLEALK